MAETLTAPDGAAIPVDPDEQRFAAAMAQPEPGAKPDHPSPKRRDPEAPHGREADGTPKAPYGYKGDGTPRVSPPGPGRGKTGPRDAGRVQAPGSAAAGGRPASPAPGTGRGGESAEQARARRAADAQTTLELLSAAGTLWSMFRLTGSAAAYKLAESKANKPEMERARKVHERATVTQLDAAACALHAEAVGAGAAQAAQSNAFAAALVDRLALFNGVASVGMAVLPLVYQVVANHAPRETRDNFPPELMALGVLPPDLLLEKLQAQNAVKMAQAQSAILAERREAENELERLREAAAV
jgi:hypothetical protein